MIEIKDLKVNFGEQEVLRGIDWFITPKSRIGLVGDNGAGKTTLLRVLAGGADHEGTITMPKGHAVGYLPQDLVEIKELPLIEYLKERAGLTELSRELAACEQRMSLLGENDPAVKGLLSEHERLQRLFESKGGFGFEVEAKQVLKGLGFAPESDAERLTSEFSGGWKMRIALAAQLLSHSDIMLLDEPTNHLDTESMEWLESWLRDYRGTIIAVSHDRRARLEAEWEQQREKIDEIQRFVERFRYKATKARQVQSRITQLEKMEITELEGPSKSVNFQFPESPRSGREVIRASGLAKSYGDHTVFRDVDLVIERGERVALVGVNGAGKSTLMRLLNQSEEPTAGTAELGLNVKKAYFSQESAKNLDYSRTIWQEVNNTGSKLLEGAKRNLLGAFLFSGDEIYKPVSVLSGGEKSRLGLLKMLLSESNLLILDEPTNHLDYGTKELFQKALLQYGGTILIVSHDRAFLDDLVSRVVEIRDGTLYDYPGNYSWFIEKRAGREAPVPAAKADPAEKLAAELRASAAEGRQEARTKEQRRAEAEERNRLYRAKKDFVERLAACEKEIADVEARKEEINGLLCSPEVLADSQRIQSLMIELKEKEETLKELYEEWEELSIKIEEIK
ncbi:ABC-F family ATP-binding cassette domain-containing protein [Cloacibacillus porcorum]|uniref:ABC-F family ATP-binding cassette domain-containing protein n=1 Tax=Cloacibacillus porcorum TaxID=1197717 RepID=UPI0023F22B0E|nr:ATP-binding cassette domain-containing protein [Cloacibacillus porcorum]